MYACKVCPGIDGLESLAKVRLAEIAHGLSPSERRKPAID
jgi:hypothetical protein